MGDLTVAHDLSFVPREVHYNRLNNCRRTRSTVLWRLHEDETIFSKAIYRPRGLPSLLEVQTDKHYEKKKKVGCDTENVLNYLCVWFSYHF